MPPAMGSVVRLGPRRRRHVPNVPGVLVRRRLGGLVRPEDPDQGGDQDPAGDGEDGPERGLGGRDQGPAGAWLVGVFLCLDAFSAAPGAAFSGHGRVAALERDRTRHLRITASSWGPPASSVPAGNRARHPLPVTGPSSSLRAGTRTRPGKTGIFPDPVKARRLSSTLGTFPVRVPQFRGGFGRPAQTKSLLLIAE